MIDFGIKIHEPKLVVSQVVEGFAGYLAVENMTDEDIAEVAKLWLKMKSLTGRRDFEN